MYSRVYVEITNQCNRNCSFCPGTSRQPGMMTMDAFGQVLQKLQGITQMLYFHLMGEPLTHPDLPEMIRAAKAEGFRSGITTNGTLLARRGKAMVEAGVYKVNISIHSFEQGAVEEYTRAEGFRSGITTNGTLLARRGKAMVEAGVYKVNISIHSFEQGAVEEYTRYIDECLDFADYASRNGVLVVLRLWNQGSDDGRNDETLLRMTRRFPQPWKEGPRGTRLQDRLYLEYGSRFRWPDLQEEDMGQQVFCYGLRDHFGILCDGTVVPCCLDHNGDIPLGSIFQQDITEILSSSRAKSMVEGFSCRRASEELCRKCGYARRFG